MNSKKINGDFIYEYLVRNPHIWKALCNTLWADKTKQKKTYFRDKTDINATTLYTLHEITGLPWEVFFIGEGEPQPDVSTIDNRIDIHHNHIDTLNANSNPEVLLAYLQMSKELLAEKDKRIVEMQASIESLQRSRDEILKRFPAVNNPQNHPDIR